MRRFSLGYAIDCDLPEPGGIVFASARLSRRQNVKTVVKECNHLRFISSIGIEAKRPLQVRKSAREFEAITMVGTVLRIGIGICTVGIGWLMTSAPHEWAAIHPDHAPVVQRQTADWTHHSLGGEVSFSYPASFVPVNDGGPYVIQAGGALMNPSGSNYLLLLGVEIDSHPHITVASAAAALRTMYRHDTLLVDTETPYGQELSYALPGGSTYTLYLTALPDGVREIVVNNEQSSSIYAPTIQTFLNSVQSVSSSQTS